MDLTINNGLEKLTKEQKLFMLKSKKFQERFEKLNLEGLLTSATYNYSMVKIVPEASNAE